MPGCEGFGVVIRTFKPFASSGVTTGRFVVGKNSPSVLKVGQPFQAPRACQFRREGPLPTLPLELTFPYAWSESTKDVRQFEPGGLRDDAVRIVLEPVRSPDRWSRHA